MFPHGRTGLERFFRIDGVGQFRLTEIDLDATDGMFSMLRDAVNVFIGGQAAVPVVFTDGGGRTVEEVVWVKEGRLLTLTYGHEAGALGGVNAVALARGLR